MNLICSLKRHHTVNDGDKYRLEQLISEAEHQWWIDERKKRQDMKEFFNQEFFRKKGIAFLDIGIMDFDCSHLLEVYEKVWLETDCIYCNKRVRIYKKRFHKHSTLDDWDYVQDDIVIEEKL